MPSGGYRKPANPAPVSGPGALSRRTDGAQPVMEGLGNGQYGAEQELQQLQGAAPLPQAPTGPPRPPVGGVDPTAGLTPLGAPSQMTDVPVTDGADLGAGADSSALGLPYPDKADAQHLGKYLPYFLRVSNDDNTPPGFKLWVRNIIANS